MFQLYLFIPLLLDCLITNTYDLTQCIKMLFLILSKNILIHLSTLIFNLILNLFSFLPLLLMKLLRSLFTSKT